jgi:hypothetical protein
MADPVDDPFPTDRPFCLHSSEGLEDPDYAGYDGPGWYFWECPDLGMLGGPFGTLEEATEIREWWLAAIRRGEGF